MKLIEEKIIKVKHIHDYEYDRFIYLEYDVLDNIIGFNFLQGDDSSDNYKLFLKSHCLNDVKMFNRYKEFKETFKSVLKKDEYEIINSFFWYYVNEINVK